MGFWPIFTKTVVDVCAWRRTVLLLVLTIAPAWLISYFTWPSGSGWPLQLATADAINRLLAVGFLWIAGFFLAYFVSANMAGSIAKEISDGSMLILVTRASRRRIVLAKFAALVMVAALLEIILVLLLVLVFRLTIPLSEDSLIALLRALLWLTPYSIIVILFFGAVSMALSALTTKLVPLMVILSCLIVGSFLVGPAARQASPGVNNSSYVEYRLYFIDPSYHLANAFAAFQKRASGGKILLTTTHYNTWISGPAVLQPAYPVTAKGWEMNLYYPVKPLGHINPPVSVAALLVFSAAVLGATIIVMERKDIH